MIFDGSFSVCFGYQNCNPRNCVAPSTVMNGADSSSMRKTLPTGCCLLGCFVPRPTGPCTPMIETFIFSTTPESTGYGSSLASKCNAAPRGDAQSIACCNAALLPAAVFVDEKPNSLRLRAFTPAAKLRLTHASKTIFATC